MLSDCVAVALPRAGLAGYGYPVAVAACRRVVAERSWAGVRVWALG